MKRSTRRALMWSVTALVWSVAAIVAAGKFALFARVPMTVDLESDPTVVRVTVDGDKVENGHYLETPTKLFLRPGHHKLKISRDGYLPAFTSISGGAGETIVVDDIVLSRLPDSQWTSVEVASEDLPQYCEIDDAFSQGETPLEVSDLVVGFQHTISCYPKWPAREGSVKCKFTPPTDSAHTPLLLKVQNKGGKLKISGCDPLPGHLK